MLGFSVVYAVFATVMRIRVLEAFFEDRERDRRRDCEIFLL